LNAFCHEDAKRTKKAFVQDCFVPSCLRGQEALIPPYNPESMNREVFAAVSDAFDRGEPAALVTIVSTTGSTPQRVGAKMLVFADGRTVGTIGGGCYENDAFWKAREDCQPHAAAGALRAL